MLTIYRRFQCKYLKVFPILADTKFEFGESDGKIALVDEVLTPDSSRYWLLSDYEVGRDQDSYDKQILRNYLIKQGWGYDNTFDPPELPEEIVQKILDRYKHIYYTLNE